MSVVKYLVKAGVQAGIGLLVLGAVFETHQYIRYRLGRP